MAPLTPAPKGNTMDENLLIILEAARSWTYELAQEIIPGADPAERPELLDKLAEINKAIEHFDEQGEDL